MLRQIRPAIIVAMAVLLSACPAPRKPAPPPSKPETPVLEPVPGAQLLNIVPADSLVRILVYRAGAMAQAGHNHVIASHEVSGRVYLHPDLEKSVFEVIIPVGTMTIDEPDLRSEEGADFSSEVSASARQGTRKNMLSKALLDGEVFPQIRIVSAGVKGSADRMAVAVRIGVKDQWRYLITPIQLKVEAGGVTATGEFDLRQSDLGLTPFSVMMGALRVQDAMHIKFRIRAST